MWPPGPAVLRPYGRLQHAGTLGPTQLSGTGAFAQERCKTFIVLIPVLLDYIVFTAVLHDNIILTTLFLDNILLTHSVMTTLL